jgi:hypothetical protein
LRRHPMRERLAEVAPDLVARARAQNGRQHGGGG